MMTNGLDWIWSDAGKDHPDQVLVYTRWTAYRARVCDSEQILLKEYDCLLSGLLVMTVRQRLDKTDHDESGEVQHTLPIQRAELLRGQRVPSHASAM